MKRKKKQQTTVKYSKTVFTVQNEKYIKCFIKSTNKDTLSVEIQTN